MSKIDEFKSFVRENPKLSTYVRENKMTWQGFYELYDLYGDKSDVWNDYLKSETNTIKSSSPSFSDILNMAKNMDVNKVQEGITSLQKAIGLISDLFIKNDNNNSKSSYTPRHIYKSFED